MDKPAFDLEKVYDEQIDPLMAQIIKICEEQKLPFVASFQYNSEGDMCSTAVLPKERPINASLEGMYSILAPKLPPALKITTKDKDGKVKSIEIIQPL